MTLDDMKKRSKRKEIITEVMAIILASLVFMLILAIFGVDTTIGFLGSLAVILGLKGFAHFIMS
jgi:cadmium resistance protein CadD (predicted permease)